MTQKQEKVYQVEEVRLQCSAEDLPSAPKDYADAFERSRKMPEPLEKKECLFLFLPKKIRRLEVTTSTSDGD